MNNDLHNLIQYLTVTCKDWTTTATMDDEFEDDNGDMITVRDVIGDEAVPDDIPDILDGRYCEDLDLPRGSTCIAACNEIRRELTGEHVDATDEKQDICMIFGWHEDRIRGIQDALFSEDPKPITLLHTKDGKVSAFEVFSLLAAVRLFALHACEYFGHAETADGIRLSDVDRDDIPQALRTAIFDKAATFVTMKADEIARGVYEDPKCCGGFVGKDFLSFDGDDEEEQ